MTTIKSKEIPLKAYSITELARIYEMDPRTLKKWIRPFETEIGEKRGRFYTIPQVKIIFEKLDLPSVILIS